MKTDPDGKKRKRAVAVAAGKQAGNRIRDKKKNKIKKKVKNEKRIENNMNDIGIDEKIAVKSPSTSLMSSIFRGNNNTSTIGTTASSSLINSIFDVGDYKSTTIKKTSATMSLFSNPKIPVATRRYQPRQETPFEKKEEAERTDTSDEDNAETIRRTLRNRKNRSYHRPLLRQALDFPGVFSNEEEDEENGGFLLDDENERAKETADAIRDHGFCVLRNVMDNDDNSNSDDSRETNNHHPIRDVVLPEAKDLQRKLNKALKARGIHHSTETFRFRESASRCKGRTDVVFDVFERDPTMVNVKQKVFRNSKIFPVIRNLLGGTGSGEVKLVYAGLIFSYPGSCDQPWHQDGEPLFPELPRGQSMVLQAKLPPYALNVFLPLEDGDGSIEKGPTEFLPGSHKWTDADERLKSIIEKIDDREDDDERRNASDAFSTSDDETIRDDKAIIAPVLKQGDALIYDYRVCHRGTANLFGRLEAATDDSKGMNARKKTETKKKARDSEINVGGSRRILYLMYARPWFTDHVNFDYRKSAESLWDARISINAHK